MKMIIGLMILMMVMPLAVASTSYTPTTQTVCDKGLCTKTLYSGTTFVEEDNQWKTVENARSLKGKGFDVVYLEEDGTHFIEVIDFNATSIQVKVDVKGISVFPYSAPLQVKQDSKDGTTLKQVSPSFNLLKQSNEYTLDFGFDKVLEFGEHSTTIMLNNPESDIFDDAHGLSNAPTTNYGSAESIRAIDSSTSIGNLILRFNISSIPESSSIEKAELGLYISSNALDVSTEGFNISTHQVLSSYNKSWTEEGLIWNNLPNATQYNMTTTDDKRYFGGYGERESVWEYWDVTSILQAEEYKNNVSILLISHDYFGSPGVGDQIIFYSKEHATNRPRLNVTYSRPEHYYDFLHEEHIWGYELGFLNDPVPPNNSNPPALANPPFSSLTEITTQSALDYSDNVDRALEVEDSGNPNEAFYLFNVSLQEQVGTIDYINWTWEGATSDLDIDMYFYLWDYENNEWDACREGGISSTSDTNYNCYNETNVYWQDGVTTFMVFATNGGSTDEQLYTDFIKLEVGYNPAPINCTAYSSGNYTLDCSTNCHITENYNLLDNWFITQNSGIIYLDYNITNSSVKQISNGCKLQFTDGVRLD